MVLAQNKWEDQWKGTEDPVVNPCSHNYLLFDKEAQNICWRKDRLFNKWCWGLKRI
jgi:hypothetical protein